MKNRIANWVFLLFFGTFSNSLSGQTASGVTYGIADCNTGGCPAVSTLRSNVSAVYFDTINEVVYIGGNFSTIGTATRNGLAAIDAATGSLLSFAPTVNNGTVLAIAKSGDTLFIGGTFTQVNGQPRNRIAALLVSTAGLCTNFNVGTSVAADSVMTLLCMGTRLFVGGRFTNIASSSRTNFAAFNVFGSIDILMASTNFQGPIRKLEVNGNNLLALYRNNITHEDAIDKIQFTSGNRANVIYTGASEQISDIVQRGPLCFVIGYFFSINGISRTITACVNVNTSLLTSWNPQPALFTYDGRSRFNIEYYRDSLYIGVFDASSVQTAYHKLYVSHYTAGNLRTLKTYASNNFGIDGFFCDHISIGNARLFEVERYQHHSSYPLGSDDCRFYSWCLKPPASPGPFSIAPSQVCPGDSNRIYSVTPQSYFTSYIWSSPGPYIFPSGNSVGASVDFSYQFSGTGTIRVWGVTSCGISTSSFRSTTISALPQPNANAGPDDSITCILNQLLLHGTSFTSGASFAWDGPNSMSTSDSITADTVGVYVLCVHGPNGCWRYDTTMIAIDTLAPAIIPFNTIGTLTCRDGTVMLEAAPIYPGDSLYWSGPGLIPHSDPASVTQSGNFSLQIVNRGNGCVSSDTIYVGSDYVIPQAMVMAPDTILTCNISSVILDAGSLNNEVIFQWRDTSGTVFQNPYADSIPGVYQLIATDTVNGCENVSNFVLITTWYAQPGILPLMDSTFFNCSFSSLLLDADSLTANAALQWTGPNNYSSADPAMVTQQGLYFVNAIHPQTGCVSVDSVYIGYQPILVVNAGNDTAICPGSGAVLMAFPVGGTPAFNYSWSNSAGNTQFNTVYPADTTEYIVSVLDASGCSGSDTIGVNVPDPIADSVLTFQPCDPLQPTGQIQVFAFNGVPPFQYSIDNGLTWITNGIFGNLPYGNYSVMIQDALGCSQTINASIDTNSLQPAPDFLVSTSPMQGDTIVLVDISNPRPDSVHWFFPPAVLVVDSNMFAPVIVSADTGDLLISMHVFFGDCETILDRTISVHPFDPGMAASWNSNGIDTVSIFPNPNNGIFNATVHLFHKQNFVILVYDVYGTEHARMPVYDADAWTGTITVQNPVPGNYVLRVVAEYDSEEELFVIMQ